MEKKAKSGAGKTTAVVKKAPTKATVAVKKTGAATVKKATAAGAPAKRKSSKKVTGPTIAVFVDIENANVSRDNLLELFTNLKNKGTVTYGKLYGFRFDKAADFDEVVAEYRLETVGRMRFKHGDDSVVDTRLVVDAIVAAEGRKFDFVFVWAGVGDLMTLFAHIRQLGCKVMTVDLPVFDTANKFVDSKVKLFSPHSLHKPVPVAGAAAVAAYSAGAAVVPPVLPTINPALVRNSGASGGSGVSSTVTKQDSFAAIADDEDSDEDFDEDDFDGLDEDFNLDDIDDLDEDDLGDDEEDDSDYDDFDDLDDEEEDEEVEEEVSGADIFTADENEKLLALTQQMYAARQRGDKKFDIEKAAKNLPQSNADDAESGVGGGPLEGAPGGAGEDEESRVKYGSAGFDYNAEQSGILADAKTDDDFDDFGKL